MAARARVRVARAEPCFSLKFHHRPPEFFHYIKYMACFLGLGF